MMIISPMRRIALASLALVATAGCNQFKRKETSDPVKWTVAPVTHPWRSASFDTLHLSAKIEEGWYIYSLTEPDRSPQKMTVTVTPAPPFFIDDKVSGPAPGTDFDILFNMNTERYTGEPKFIVPVSVDTVTGTPPAQVELSILYQACNATACLPARTTMLSKPVTFAKH